MLQNKVLFLKHILNITNSPRRLFSAVLYRALSLGMLITNHIRLDKLFDYSLFIPIQDIKASWSWRAAIPRQLITSFAQPEALLLPYKCLCLSATLPLNKRDTITPLEQQLRAQLITEASAEAKTSFATKS